MHTDQNDNLQVSLSGSNPVLIAHGTSNVTSQYPQTATITQPSQVFKRFILAMYNASGQNISNVSVIAQNAQIDTYTGTDYEVSGKSPTFSGFNNNAEICTFNPEQGDPYLFLFSQIKIQFNLAAASTSGTINWALYGQSAY